MEAQACPCGSSNSFDRCCLPIIQGKKKAKSAEACMRARYSAFADGAIDFLVASHHPDTRSELERDEVERWALESTWLGLNIVATSPKGESEGEVEFVASYLDPEGKEHHHHEKSLFKKEGDMWFFVDGEILLKAPQRRSSPKLGRNDPCHCGSGKKYKKCCAA